MGAKKGISVEIQHFGKQYIFNVIQEIIRKHFSFFVLFRKFKNKFSKNMFIFIGGLCHKGHIPWHCNFHRNLTRSKFRIGEKVSATDICEP